MGTGAVTEGHDAALLATACAVRGEAGAQKTTVAATLARLAAGHDIPVVPVDADTNPNPAAAIAVSRSAIARLTGTPTSACRASRQARA